MAQAILEGCTTRPASGATAHFTISGVGSGISIKQHNYDERDAPPPTLNYNSGVDLAMPDAPIINEEQAVSSQSDQYTASFDVPFTEKPFLDIVEGYAVNNLSWSTNANGHYDAVDIAFSSVPSELTWKVRPQNAVA